MYLSPFSSLASIGITHWSQIVLGAAKGIVTVTGMRRLDGTPQALPPYPERAFGNYHTGRWGWETKNPRRFKTPIPARGFQQIWRWTPPAEAFPFVFAAGSEPTLPPAVNQPSLF